jgi:hypothetical protein
MSSLSRSGCPARVRGEYNAGAISGNVRAGPTIGRNETAAISRRLGASRLPPAVVQASTSERTRSPVIEREVLSDHAAHRSADQVGLLDSGGVKHGERVSHHARHRQTLWTREDPPVPRLSNTIARWRRATWGSRRHHIAPLPASPMIISSVSGSSTASDGPLTA